MTDVVAWLAFVVAAGSLGVSYLAYRQGKPKVTASASITVITNEDVVKSLASVLVVNSSPAAVTVDDVSWWDPEDPWSNYKLSRGPELPFRLEGQSSERWNLSCEGERGASPVVSAGQRQVRKMHVTRDRLPSRAGKLLPPIT